MLAATRAYVSENIAPQLLTSALWSSATTKEKELLEHENTEKAIKPGKNIEGLGPKVWNLKFRVSLYKPVQNKPVQNPKP